MKGKKQKKITKKILLHLRPTSCVCVCVCVCGRRTLYGWTGGSQTKKKSLKEAKRKGKKAPLLSSRLFFKKSIPPSAPTVLCVEILRKRIKKWNEQKRTKNQTKITRVQCQNRQTKIKKTTITRIECHKVRALPCAVRCQKKTKWGIKKRMEDDVVSVTCIIYIYIYIYIYICICIQ